MIFRSALRTERSSNLNKRFCYQSKILRKISKSMKKNKKSLSRKYKRRRKRKKKRKKKKRKKLRSQYLNHKLQSSKIKSLKEKSFRSTWVEPVVIWEVRFGSYSVLNME